MSTTRRTFLATAAALAAAPSLLAQQALDPLRPRFHLMPRASWMNDPNGPVFWRGKYHLFFQVNPHNRAAWGDISWAHAVSADMLHWRLLGDVMEPEGTGSAVAAAPGAPDSYGVFSGSAAADGDRVLFFYTAVSESTRADATLHDPKHELREQQCVAVSTGDLTHFARQSTPLIARPPAALQPIAGFRDPCVWREGKTWWMALGSGTIDKAGAVLLYRATVPAGDAADWSYVGPLFTAPGNGRHTPDTVDAGTMIECPDFFELDGHHVLLYSTERKVFWLTGELDRADMRFEPKRRGLLDSGAFYAPKSQLGAHGERILWGWIPERRSEAAQLAAGWSGVMSLPRVLHIDAHGDLVQRVPPIADTLAAKPQRVAPGAGVPGLQARIAATLAEGGSLRLSMGSEEVLRLDRSGTTLRIADTTVDLPGKGPLDLKLYVDASVIEVFADGGRVAHTARVYPQLAPDASLHVQVSGGTGTLAAMRSALPVA